MKKILTVILLAAGVSAGRAQAQEIGPIIWNDLRLGMAKAEVNALYPKKATSILPGCDARVNGQFVEGRLAQVSLTASKSDPAARCAEVIEASLIRKYGQAVAAQEYENRKCTPLSQFRLDKFGEQCRRNVGEPVVHLHNLAWMSQGIQIILTREEVCPCSDAPSPDVWSLLYRPALGSDQDAASKL